MSVTRRVVLKYAPEPLKPVLVKHREALKFLVVGGTCFIVTFVINYSLKLTLLTEKPVTALTLATIVSSILSYILNREWSFRTRGGRRRRHEATLFFLVCAIAVGVNDIPLYFSRYVLHLQEPSVSLLTQEIADFVSGIVIGTLLAMIFRLWAFKKFVFPLADARPQPAETSARRGSGARSSKSAVIVEDRPHHGSGTTSSEPTADIED